MRAPEKIQKGAEEIKRAHRSSLHSVPLAIRLISKPTPRTFQVHTKQNRRIISCFPAWDRMREDWKQKRKQAPEPDGGGACVWILNLSLCSSVNALYQILPLVLGVQDGTPVKVAVLQAVDQHLGSGNVGGNRNIVHIADAQQVHLVGLRGLSADGVTEEK